MFKICIYNYDEIAIHSQSTLTLDSGTYGQGDEWKTGLLAPAEWISDSDTLVLAEMNDGSGGLSTPYMGGLNDYLYLDEGPVLLNTAPRSVTRSGSNKKISYLNTNRLNNHKIAYNNDLSYSSNGQRINYSSGDMGLMFDEDHGLCIHDDETITDHDKVVEPVLHFSDSAAGTLEFTIPLTNIGYGKMKRMVTVVSVFRDHEEIFSGRVLSEEDDFWGRQKICVEGELAYLNDTTQPPAVINGTVREYVCRLIERHNDKIRATAPFKQFQVGVVSISYENLTKAYGDANEWLTNFEPTLELLNNLVSDVNGHMEIIKSGGVRTLNIYDDWPRTSSQSISFGVNLLDFSQKYDMSELATVLIPLGKLEDQVAKGDEIFFLPGAGEQGWQNNKVAVSPVDGFAIYDASCFVTKIYEVFRDPVLVENCQSLKFKYSSRLPSGFIEFAVFDGSGNCMTTTNSDGNGKVDFEVSIQNTARYVYVSSYYDQGLNYGIFPVLYLSPGQTYKQEYWTYEELTRDEIVNPNTNPPTTANVVYDRKPKKETRDVDVIVNFNDWNPNYGFLIREHNLITDNGAVDINLGLRWVNEQYSAYGPISCQEGDKFYYSGECNEKFFMYVFLDANGTVKGSKMGQECFDANQHNTVEDELITAPQGATQLHFTCMTNTFHLWKYNTLYDKQDKALTVETAIVDQNTGAEYGSYYVINENAVRTFGWIEKIIEFNDVTDPTDLLEKARLYLSSAQFDQLEINVSALDLIGMGVDVDALRLLDSVRCISEPHGLDDYFPIREIELPLDKPDGARYTLGEDLKLTLTDTNWDANADLKAQIENLPTRTSVLDAAKEQATAVMNQRNRGYVSIVDTDRFGTCIYISDSEDYTHARRMWLWNLNGLGYSKDGGEHFNLAITMDGAIVADFITAGTMSADRVRTGKIIDVNGYNWWDLSNGELVIGHNHMWVETRGLDPSTGQTTILKRETLEEYSVNQYKIFQELFGVPDGKRRVNGIRGMTNKISDVDGSELYEYNLYISASMISSGVLMSDTDSFFFDLHNGTMVSTAKYRGFADSNGIVSETGPSFDKFLQFLYCSVLGFTGGSYQPTTFDPYTGEVIKLGGIVGIEDPNSNDESSAELNGALDLAQTYPDGKHVTLASKNSIILSYGDTFYVEKGDIVTGEIEYSDDTDLRDGYVVNNTPRQFIFGETELFEGDGSKFQFDVDVRLNNKVTIGYDKNEYENPYPDVYIPISSGSLEVRGNTTLGRSTAFYETDELKTLKKKKQAYNPQTGNNEYIYSLVADPNNPGKTKKEYVYEYYDKPYKQKHYLDKVQINGDVNVTGTIKTSSIDIDDTISLNHVIAKKCIKVGQDYASGFFDDCVWETDSEMLEIQGYDSTTASRSANSTNVFCGVNLFYDTAAFYSSGSADSAITGYGMIEYLLSPYRANNKNNNKKDYDNMSNYEEVLALETLYKETEADIASLVDHSEPSTGIKKYRLVTEGGILTVGDSKFFGALMSCISPGKTFQVLSIPADYTNIANDAEIKNFDTTLVSGKAKVLHLAIHQAKSQFGIYDFLVNGYLKVTCGVEFEGDLDVGGNATIEGNVYANGLSYFDDEAEFHNNVLLAKVNKSSNGQETIEERVLLGIDGSVKVKASTDAGEISISRSVSGTEKKVTLSNGNITATGNATIGGNYQGKGSISLNLANNSSHQSLLIANSGSVTITDSDNSPSDANSEFLLIQNSTHEKYVKLLSDGVLYATGSGVYGGNLTTGGAFYVDKTVNNANVHVVTISNDGNLTIKDPDSNGSTTESNSKYLKIQNTSGTKYITLYSDGVLSATGGATFGGTTSVSGAFYVKDGSTTKFTVTTAGAATATSLQVNGNVTIKGGTLYIQNSNGVTGFQISYDGALTCSSATINGTTYIKGGTFYVRNSNGDTDYFRVSSSEVVANKPLTVNGSTYIKGGTLYIQNSSGVTGFQISYDGALACSSAKINGTTYIDGGSFYVRSSNGGTEYFKVTSSGATVSNPLTVNGSTYIKGGTLYIQNSNGVTGFQISYDGALTCSSAKITGTTYIDGGTFYVRSSNGYSEYFKVSSSEVTASKPLTVSGSITGSSLSSTAGITAATTVQAGGSIRSDSGLYVGSGASQVFSVNSAGFISASSGISVSGSVTAGGSGTFPGGLTAGGSGTLADGYLYTPTVSLRGDVYINGNYVSVSNGTFVTSDLTLKHDVKEITFDCLYYVKKINSVSFRWNSNDSLVPAGFIAQDIEEIDKEHSDEENYSPFVIAYKDGTKGIDYNKLTAVLWKAVAELSEKVDQLTSKLEALT